MALDAKALETLLEVIGGDRSSMTELIESFEGEAPRLMQQMQVASAAENLEALRRAAHTMKSSARDFGAVELSRLCEILEHQCRVGDLSGAPGLLEAIAPAFASTMADLAAVKRTYGDG